MKSNSGQWPRISVTLWSVSYCPITGESVDGMAGKVVQIEQ